MIDWFFERYDRVVTRLGGRLGTVVMLSLGVLMVFYGATTAYDFVSSARTVLEFARIASSVIMAVAGLIIIFDTGRTLLKTVVLFTLALGLFRSISYFLMIKNALPSLMKVQEGLTFLDYMNYVVAVFYVIMFLLALMMFVTALAILMGFSFRRNSLIYTCMLMIVTSVFRLWFITLFGSVGDLLDFSNSGRFVEIALFTLALWICDSPEVRARDASAKHVIKMGNIRGAVVSDSVSHVLPDVADGLVDPQRRRWRTLMDCGPVAREYEFQVIGKEHNVNNVVVQEWSDDPVLHVTVSGYRTVTVLFPNTFSCDVVSRVGNDVVFAGRSGVNMVIPIRETKTTDKFGLFKERD